MKNTNFAFLSTLIPYGMEEKIAALSQNNMQDAANALQWHLYNGLCKNLNTEIMLLNILPVGSYPQYYKEPFVKQSLFSTPYYPQNVNIGFCNIKLIRKFLQPCKVYNALDNWCHIHKGNKVLFVYTITATFITAISKVKEKYPDLKVCAIVADLPDMVSLKANKGILQTMFEKRLSGLSYNNLDSIDAFVLLTRQMADYMRIRQPFCVVEGISTFPEKSKDIQDTNQKIIVYTGTLHKKFGIMNLIEAFMAIEGSEYRLIICGIGDSEKEIEAASVLDRRIEYKGLLSRTEILKVQKTATVLVNPRQNNEEFTKYSFPSKNLEYLSSGKPLIAYKLDGIPDDYDDYIYYVPDNSIKTLQQTLVYVCTMNAAERSDKALKAQRFVWEEKNEIKQTKKIIDFLRKRGILND